MAKSTGLPSATEVASAKVNALGQAKESTDRNGNVHAISFDDLGRPTTDIVSTLGAGVNGNVRALATQYDGQGNPYLMTSYSNVMIGPGVLVNEVKRDFNGLGQMTSEWQDHNAAVSGSSPRVQYAYSFLPARSNNDSRPTSMTYPNGTVIGYTYTAGLDATISRLSSMTVSGTTVEGYNYLGLGSVVKRTHTGPGVDLTYVKLAAEAVGDAGDQYTGLDRFGRVVSQRWIKTSTSTNVDQYGYTYDRDSNRTAKTNGLNAAFNETYGYDSLNQLTSFAKTGTTKSWDYDAVGNWDGVTTNAVTESRTQNKQNEILTATGQTAPTYDINGNQTGDFAGRAFTYDAWNRTHSAATRTYEYDAMGRRIEEVTGGVTTDFFHTAAWQTIEERDAGTTRRINVWSPVYVDALLFRDRDADVNGSLEERLWAMQDANYNVTGLLNSTGSVQERYTYDPYGTATVYDANYVVRGSSSFGWITLHQGLRWDATTGKYHARNRDYDPAEGRWTTMDPLGFAAGDVNLNRALGGNAVNALDWNGLEKKNNLRVIITFVVNKVGVTRASSIWHSSWATLYKVGSNVGISDDTDITISAKTVEDASAQLRKAMKKYPCQKIDLLQFCGHGFKGGGWSMDGEGIFEHADLNYVLKAAPALSFLAMDYQLPILSPLGPGISNIGPLLRDPDTMEAGIRSAAGATNRPSISHKRVDALRSLKDYLTPDAQIVFKMCNQAKGDDGKEWLIKNAKMWGRNVHANDGLVAGVGLGSWYTATPEGAVSKD